VCPLPSVFYGYLTKHYFPIFSTFIVGDILCVTYITIFYIYSPEKRKSHRVFSLAGPALLLLTLYGFLGGFGVTHQPRQQVGNVFGVIGILTNLMLYSAPFEKVAMVLKHKSGVFINIHMVCAGTFNNSTWIVYTTLTQQWLVFAPNVFCCCMGLIQISLYWIYHPSTHPYDGPMPGDIQPMDDVVVDVELGELTDKTRAKSFAAGRPDSPAFMALESPLEPLRAFPPQPTKPAN
jgi:solute carrier family 50 (sugar transporter)